MHRHDDHQHGGAVTVSRSALHEELVHHLPFSVSAVALGLTLAGLICFMTPAGRAIGPETDRLGQNHAEADHADQHAHDNPFQDLFHLFHPLHMLFSAAATTAMFWRYERRVFRAVVVGLVGAVGVCGLSDIVIPHCALLLLKKPVPWHICLINNPRMVLTFAAVGVVVGLTASVGVRRSTFFSHSLHVFSSTMASIFYLIGPFGPLGWIDSVGTVFILIILAVMVPCCLSDIVFPLLLSSRARQRHHDDEHVGGGAGHVVDHGAHQRE